MKHCRTSRTLLLASSLFVVGPGCTTLRTVPPPVTPAEEPFFGVAVGDRLELTLNDGRRVVIEVQRLEGDVIVSGEGVRYARTEIATVKARRVNAGKTALAVAGIIAGAYAALVAVVWLLLNGL